MNARHLIRPAPPHRLPREGEILGSRVTRDSRPDYKIDHETGCWVWQKALTKHGYTYGHMHRRYWERANGPIPKAHDVHHVCRNRACLNPDHLECITAREHDLEHFLYERGGLTLAEVREIRELGRKRETKAGELARRYGVHEATIYAYWSVHSWPDILGEAIVKEPGVCKRCGGEIGPEKKRHAVYCKPECQVLWNKEKRRKAVA